MISSAVAARPETVTLKHNSPAPVVGDDVVPDRPALGAGTVVPGEVDPEGGAR